MSAATNAQIGVNVRMSFWTWLFGSAAATTVFDGGIRALVWSMGLWVIVVVVYVVFAYMGRGLPTRTVSPTQAVEIMSPAFVVCASGDGLGFHVVGVRSGRVLMATTDETLAGSYRDWLHGHEESVVDETRHARPRTPVPVLSHGEYVVPLRFDMHLVTEVARP